MLTFYMKLYWSRNQRRLLSRCSAGKTFPNCYQKYGPKRLFYFSAGQWGSPRSQINHRSAKTGHTRVLYSSYIMASEQSRFPWL